MTVSVTVTSVGDGLADAGKADLNWKLKISNNQCGLDWGRSSTILSTLIKVLSIMIHNTCPFLVRGQLAPLSSLLLPVVLHIDATTGRQLEIERAKGNCRHLKFWQLVWQRPGH